MPSKSPVENKCGAQIRNSVSKFGCLMYCTNAPEPGRKRCKFHGGRSPRGADSPHYRGRGWSKDIPTRLMDRFKDALEDHDLTSLQAEIALLDSRMGELLEALDEAGISEKWQQLGEFLAAAKHALDAENYAEVREVLDMMKGAIESALGDYKQWHAIYDLVDNRRKLVDTERKREEFLAGTMTTRQAMAFVTALQTAIIEEIADVEVRRRLGIRIRFLLGEGHDEATEKPRLSIATAESIKDKDRRETLARVQEAEYTIEEDTDGEVP